MPLNQMSPDCPNCGAWITKVIMTKLDNDCEYVVRRRHCDFCDYSFYSRQAREEVVEVKWVPCRKGTVPKIVKVLPTKTKPRYAA